MERLKISGMEVEAYVQGEGRALLFLHGEDYFQQHRPFLDALARTWRVIAPRHPGFGSTPLPDHFMKVDDLAYLYLDLLDDMQIERPLVVGASFGGWIALELAVRVPERIDRLALLGTFGVKLGGRYERDFADIFQAPESDGEIGRARRISDGVPICTIRRCGIGCTAFECQRWWSLATRTAS
jgi:pimeloyl-ACP methyl ester carboxylesterase